MRCSVLFTSIAVACLVTSRGPAGEPRSGGFGFEQLTPSARAAIDARAVRVRDKNHKAQVQREFYGDVTSWLISRTPLPAMEEVRRADDAHQRIAEQTTLSQAAPEVRKLFKRLVGELPQRMRPHGFVYSLYVIDDPGREAFTVGGGRIYVPKNYLAALRADGARGRDRLAFVLAHELGHICRGHTRRSYQLLWLDEHLKDGANHKVESERRQKLLERSIDVAAKRLTFLYSDEQEYQADLFAIHLCRNAGFDVETCLDPLRERIAVAEPKVLTEADEPRASSEPGTQSRQNGEAGLPQTLQWRRLKRLRAELDGTVSSNEYGLFEFDPVTSAAVAIARGSIGHNERVLILVHGMESDVKVFRPLAEYLAKQSALRTLVFRYPNDGSLARSSKLLKREIDRVRLSPGKADFVCHSAGGLVFRWFAEVEGVPFRTAVLMGTPNRGSDLTKLRTLLEAKQFLGDLKLGYSEALERVILDSNGLISFDLQPESLFLRYLNRERKASRATRTRYAIIRGRALKPRYALLAGTSAAAGRVALRRTLKKRDADSLMRAEAGKWIERLRVPREVSHGDLAVTLESATLTGAGRMTTFRTDHVTMLRHSDVLKSVAEWLEQEDAAHE